MAVASRPTDRPAAIHEDRTAGAIGGALQSLDAQAALLPYALIFFGIALPIFAWACSYAADQAWMTASFAIFAINWAAFYTNIDWMKRHPERQIGCRPCAPACTSWAGCCGRARWRRSPPSAWAPATRADPFCCWPWAGRRPAYFSPRPIWPMLLIVGPAASAPPVLGLYADASTRPMGHIVLAATALVMALSLILNRLFRKMFALASEREVLVEERGRSLDEAQRLAKSKSDLVDTLSHEIRNGLSGVADVLAAATGAGRAVAHARADERRPRLGPGPDRRAECDPRHRGRGRWRFQSGPPAAGPAQPRPGTGAGDAASGRGQGAGTFHPCR